MSASTRVFPLVAAAISVAALAQGQGTPQACTDASLRGAYAFTANGVVLATAPLPPPLRGPFASTGTATYDGNGNVVLSASASFNGFTQALADVKGTYHVNPDCTFTSTLENGVGFYAVVADNGEELFVQQTTPGTVIYGTARRLVSQRRETSNEDRTRCDATAVNRTYGFIATGFGNPPYVPEELAGPQSGVGTVTFNLDGTFVINAFSATNGIIDEQPAQLTGSYELLPGCRFTMQADAGLTFTGTILNGGREMETVETDPGAVVLIRTKSIR